jgi:ATP-dependent exoDNAse (exonuclease V) alpha subunit
MGVVLDVGRTAAWQSISMAGRSRSKPLRRAGNVQLAYATSIHKVQGSEFPARL